MTTPANPRLPRRTFLGLTGAATAAAAALGQWPLSAQDTAAQLSGEDAKAPTEGLDASVPQIRVLLHEADGTPLEAERARTLMAFDMAGDPLPQPMAFAEGRARIALAKEPIQLAVQLKVPGFGEVYCFADNGGKGYTKPETIEFSDAATVTRVVRAIEAHLLLKEFAVPEDPKLEQHYDTATQIPILHPDPKEIHFHYQALSHALHAGEMATLNLARHRISKLAAPRKDFLFGCLASGWQRGGDWEKAFVRAFNYGVTSWYAWSQNPEPESQRINYDRMDNSVAWCLERKIVPKNFGYVYLTNGATPEWFRQWPYEKVLPEYKRIVEQTMRRFAGRVPFVEVINEAHDKANLFRFSHEQVLELTREACAAARRGAPTVKRLINHCCLWAEYAKRANPGGVRRWSPFRYLKDCERAGVEFERVGLQLYYPRFDLLEIDRMLERFKAFKRPIHITELSCNSADGLDPASMRPKSLVPGWHGPWTESMQADWLEAIYTLCYSKPEFEAVGYWDLSDTGGHFWPHGGLLRKDLTPKPSYHRLLELQQKWGVGKA